MSKHQDPDYLLNQQYHTAEKLNDRIRLHTEFSTNDYGWFRWVFDHFRLSPKSRILELGCGPGDLWAQNSNRIPREWEITLSDFSAGMIAKARRNLSQQSHPFRYKIIDAQSLPFGEDQFEAVIANHCLYHFPDRQKALSEIHRVLKTGGIFYTTTVGKMHLKEMAELVVQYDPTVEDAFPHEANPFTLENGKSQLKTWFSNIQIDRYADSLHVTEVEPLVAFIISTIRFGLDESRRADFSKFLESQIEAKGGAIRIQKDSGMFMMVKD